MSVAQLPLVERPWLEREVLDRIEGSSGGILLILGEPGSGKSTLLAELHRKHPRWPIYAIRRGSIAKAESGYARDFLMSVATQLERSRPTLFAAPPALEVHQRLGRTTPGSHVVGVEVDELVTGPFGAPSVEVVQDVEQLGGDLTGVVIGRLVDDPRLLDTDTLFRRALVEPALRVPRAPEDERDPVVVLVDAVDEAAFAGGSHADTVLRWLEAVAPLPANLHLVVGTRGDHSLLAPLRRSRAGELWELDLDARRDRTERDLAALCVAALRETAPELLDARVRCTTDEWVDAIVAKAAGNFLYVTALLREALHDHRQGEPLLLPDAAEIPEGMGDVLDFLLARARDRVGDAVAPLPRDGVHVTFWGGVCEPVLGVLAAALEPLTVPQLARLADTGAPVRVVRDAVRVLAPVTAQRGDAVRLFHSSIAEHLFGASRFPLEPVEWHHRIADVLWRDNAGGWRDTPDRYALDHLLHHLRSAGDRAASERARELVLSADFLVRKLELCDVEPAVTDLGLSADSAEDDLRGPLQRLCRVIELNQGALHDGFDVVSTLRNGLVADGVDSVYRTILRSATDGARRPAWMLTTPVEVARPAGRRQLGGAGALPFDCAIDRDGGCVVTASEDGPVRRWALPSGRPTGVLTPGGGITRSCAVALAGRVVLAGQADGTLLAWVDDRPVRVDRVHSDAVLGCAIAADGRCAVSVGLDGLVAVWALDVASARAVLSRTVRTGAGAYSCALADDGTVLAGDAAGRLHVLTHTGEHHVAPSRGAILRSCAVSADGSVAVTGSYLGEVAVWDVPRREITAILSGHRAAVFGCGITADGAVAVSAGLDGTVRMWSPAASRCTATWAPHDDHVLSCAVDGAGGRIVSVSTDRTVRWWPRPSGDLPAPPATGGPGGEVVRCAFAGRERLVSASTDGSVCLWRAGDLAAPTEILERGILATALGTSADGRVVLVGTAEGSLLRYDVHTRRLRTLARERDAPIVSCALDRDGSHALVGDDGGGLELWRVGATCMVRTLESPHDDWVLDAASGAGLAATVQVGDGPGVGVWDLRSGSLLRVLQHPVPLVTAAVSSNGRYLCHADVSGAVTVEESRTGERVDTYEPVDGARVLRVAVGDDGRRCVTVDVDGALRAYDGGRLLVAQRLGVPASAAVSDDLRRIAVGSSLGHLTVYTEEDGSRV